jgi:hypothetical protein
MVRRDDTKTQALAASRTLNPRPERVTDPADLVQVKYEMVPRAEVAEVPTGQAAAAFGFSRQSLYSARTALRARARTGRSGPGQAWPQGRSQAHRPGRGPTRGTSGGRPRPAVGGAGRRGLAAFRRQRPSAFRSGGRCSAAAAGSGGWRHGLSVLVPGVAAWMAAWASLSAASYRNPRGSARSRLPVLRGRRAGRAAWCARPRRSR